VNDGFEAFFGEHYGVVERAVALTIGDRGRAEELTQEAFARAYQRWRRVSRMDRPVAWVYVVALNAERKRWRREKNAPAPEPPDPQGDDIATAVVTTIVLREAIVRLPPRQRAAIVLRYLADLSTAEVAQAMGCADGTVKATIHQALKNLRIDVEGDDV
jgi:RNA polymerase sigma-70 factor (ECF subfamily)